MVLIICWTHSHISNIKLGLDISMIAGRHPLKLTDRLSPEPAEQLFTYLQLCLYSLHTLAKAQCPRIQSPYMAEMIVRHSENMHFLHFTALIPRYNALTIRTLSIL